MAKASGSLVKRFSVARKWLSDVDTTTASNLITAASDIALVVNANEDGLISDVSFGSDEVEREINPQDLLGKPWVETVTVESRPKIQALLSDALAKANPRWRQVNHTIVNGDDLPVIYSAVQVGARGRVVAMGRSMRPMASMQQQLIEAQRSMEREYSRLRQAETRHRLLFQVASEAVVVVDAATRKVVEANPAAMQMLGDTTRRLVGRALGEAFAAPSRRTLEGLFAKVSAAGHAEEYPLRPLADAGRAFRVSASLFHEGRSDFFLVRLLPADLDADSSAQQRRKSRVFEVVEGSPDGFVVTDIKGLVQFANRAFLEFVQLAAEEQVRGEPLDRWLGRPGLDFSLLAGQLREHRTLKQFSTVIRGEYGSSIEVEIGAVAVAEGETPYCGFTIRDVSNRLQSAPRAGAERPRSVEQLTELVGRVPLKELVRESTDMIERLCIEAALELTKDNRASAAEILGLSRQGLYAKLHRHGIADIGGPGGTPNAPNHGRS
jgi:transcriptional regulator PpsR